ncbi:hypothetical protein DAEQUDRAFT_769345 [Daedalea quercina L-15889]|uniref:Uncharacterized protein n=1 Tax=Daedalea quercina L-15889 TaxID=1314783 RepID=A0A165LTV4_9APHY|nr:hypothetical protein DAEQUDRAFT_769345 [Daedalea quercina L-15889]
MPNTPEPTTSLNDLTRQIAELTAQQAEAQWLLNERRQEEARREAEEQKRVEAEAQRQEAERQETEEREKGLAAAHAEKRKTVDELEEEEVRYARVPCEPCKKKGERCAFALSGRAKACEGCRVSKAKCRGAEGIPEKQRQKKRARTEAEKPASPVVLKKMGVQGGVPVAGPSGSGGHIWLRAPEEEMTDKELMMELLLEVQGLQHEYWKEAAARQALERRLKEERLAWKEDPIYRDALLTAYFREVVADWEAEESENPDLEPYQLSEEEGKGDEE